MPERDESLVQYSANPRRNIREKIEKLPTSMRGVALRVAQRIGLDLHIDALHPFVSHARRFTRAAVQEDEIQTIKKMERDRLVEILEKHEGIRGIEFGDEGVGLSISPSHRVIWDRDLLKEALGSAYTAYVREELEAKVAIPFGMRTNDGLPVTPELIQIAFQGALHDLGIFVDKKIMRTNILATHVDEDRIQELQDLGVLELPEGARRVTRTWRFMPYPLSKWGNLP